MAKSKIKLTELQVHKLQEGRRHISDVLKDIKSKPLAGADKRIMQSMEDAVNTVDLVVMIGAK